MAISKWPLLVRRCLMKRTNGDDFGDLITVHYGRNPISGRSLIKLLLKCRSSFCTLEDPLITIYLQKVLCLGLANVSDVLGVLIRHWNEKTALDQDIADSRVYLEDSAVLAHNTAVIVALESFVITPAEARMSLIFCSKWLNSIAMWVSKDADRLGNASYMTLVEAVGTLLTTLAMCKVGFSLLGHDTTKSKQEDHSALTEPKDSLRKALERSMTLGFGISQPLLQRLDALHRHITLQQGSRTDLHPDALQFISDVMDTPMIATRASLFFYLDKIRSTCATIDDSKILSFLNTRHSGDHSAMFTGLVIASFDVLGSTGNSETDATSLIRWQSFIVDKLPSLLSVISASSFGAISTEDCLRSGFEQTNLKISTYYLPKSITDLPARFLQVCSLHRLLPSSNIKALLGDMESDLIQSPALYGKEDLVNQIQSMPQKGLKLLANIGRLDGNAGVIATAIAEVINGYCQNKETLQLKELACIMLRTPNIIDVMSLFLRPSFILNPICLLLDQWRWDDLHGESQPLYDEFGNILLLIIAFKHRLGLSDSDVHTFGTSSFVKDFLQSNSKEKHLVNMTEDASKHLGEWINALFVAEGLSDEMMSSCSPQEFYLMVPTLISQSLNACESEKLSIESLQSGFDYLLEPFLLPSLVPAISWLYSPAAQRYDQRYVTQLQATLLKEPSSAEASEIHNTILGLVVGENRSTLNDTILRSPAGAAFLKHANFLATTSTNSFGIKAWSSMPGGLLSVVRQGIESLVNWTVLQSNLTKPPPSNYLCIECALEVLGAEETIRYMLEELSKQNDGYGYSEMVDLMATIICSFDKPESITKLVQALQLEQQTLQDKLNDGKEDFAKAVIRLNRRVELFSIVVAQPEMTMDVVTSLMPVLTEADLQNIDMSTSQLNNTATNSQSQQGDPGQEIDQMLDAAAAMGGVDQHVGSGMDMDGNLDDMYMGLETDDMDLNFDDLDMEGMFEN